MRPMFDSARYCRRQPRTALDERPRPLERQIVFQQSKTTCPLFRPPMGLKRAKQQMRVIASVMAFDAIMLLWHPVPYEGVTCIP
jgi:hypothetical protein